MSEVGSYERKPIAIIYEEKSAYKDTYAGAEDTVFLEAHHLIPSKPITDSVIVFMHPAGAGGAYLPMPIALARSGIPVIYCNSRYRGVDSGLIMEKVVMDLGACVREAKTKLGYQKIILGGWSGGVPGASRSSPARWSISPRTLCPNGCTSGSTTTTPVAISSTTT